MTNEPDEVMLDDENKKRLAKLADLQGKDWSEVLAELIDSAEAVLEIEKGLLSANRGEGTPAAEIHERLRSKHRFE